MGWVLVILLAAFADPSPQFEARVRAGLAALDRNEFGKAQAEFEQATRLSPRQGGAWLLLAQTYAKQHKPDLAIAAARKAELFGAADSQILQGLANFYATLVPDLHKAAEIGAKYAERNPSDRTAWRRLAEFCLRTGQPDAAIAAGKRGAAIDDSAELHSLMGSAYAERKQWQPAAEEFRIALKRNPFDEQMHFQLAQLYLKQQDFNSAVAVLTDARKTFDKSPQIELALGVAYYGLRKFPLAVDQFLRTIRLDPEVPQPYSFLGRMMDHLSDRMPEATARFADFQDRHPDSYLGYLLHAEALVAQLPPSGFPAEAETAFQLLEKSIALNDRTPESHYYLGLLLERKREFAKAAEQFEKSVDLNPKDSTAHFRLARVYDRLGRKEEASRERALHEKLSEEEKAPAATPLKDK
jgi:tetratricopeptide (TPR) repeat protein